MPKSDIMGWGNHLDITEDQYKLIVPVKIGEGETRISTFQGGPGIK